MAIPTLISTATPSGASTTSFTSGIDSTYDEYMFVLIDIDPGTDNVPFLFQGNVAGQSGYNETITSACFQNRHNEADAVSFGYQEDYDQAQETDFQELALSLGTDADQSMCGVLHLFSPSNTTFVTHFWGHTIINEAESGQLDRFTNGYFNVTGAIDEIQFKTSSGTHSGTIQLYGLA